MWIPLWDLCESGLCEGLCGVVVFECDETAFEILLENGWL